ncbi:MAG: SAM hydroxide adenosyltransferase, partial [Candidatus Thorarchaeota archaeon]
GAGEKFLGERKSDLDMVLRFWQEGRSGEVVRVDHFGNIITNLPPMDKDMYHLNYRALNRDITWAGTYGQGPEYDMFLVTGSAGTLELSVKNGRAADRLPARVGDTIVIK